MQIKNRLRELMKAEHLSAPKLAERSGVPLPSIKSIMSGQSNNPKIKTVMALAFALGCGVDDLISRSPISYNEDNSEPEENTLFLSVIETVDKIAAEKGISLEGKHEFRKRCVERIFAWLPEKQVIDRVFVEWVFESELAK